VRSVTTREAAGEFIKGEPFVLKGVMNPRPALEWNEIYG
jgi:hypothetical protein